MGSNSVQCAEQRVGKSPKSRDFGSPCRWRNCLNSMRNINDLTKRIIAFRDARDWKQFHNLKDVALSLVLEATEVMEHFQWKSKEEIEKYIKTNKAEIGEELADVLYWILLMSHDLKLDVLEALEKKILKNEEKYPVEKARGNAKKYTEF